MNDACARFLKAKLFMKNNLFCENQQITYTLANSFFSQNIKTIVKMVLLGLLALAIILSPVLLLLAAFYRRNLLLLHHKGSRMFQDGRPSFTAELVCIYRATSTILGWCNDPFAIEFLDWDAQLYVQFVSTMKQLAGKKLKLTMTQYLAARTSYLDDFVLAGNSEQIVILGAGLDSRAYRLRHLLKKNVKIYEVDAPATQRHKKAALERLYTRRPDLFNGAILEQCVTFVSCDFASNESFVQKLMEKGFDKSNPNTTVLLEGVASYLVVDDLKKTLQDIASFAPGTRFAMNCIEDSVRKQSLVSKLLKNVVGEEWKFAWKASDNVEEFFSPLGFKVLDYQPFEQVMANLKSLKNEDAPSRVGNFIFACEVTKRD